MKRMAGRNTIAPLVAVLAALYSVVDISTKALHTRLQRLRAARTAGLRWLDALRVSGVPSIAGGSSLTEGTYAAEFLLNEVSDGRRESITVLSGQDLASGAVVGRVTKGVGRASIPTVVGTGNGTMTAVSAGPEVELGSYVVTCTVAATNGGTFSVVTPSGLALPTATVATPYVSRHINFTINDSSTDFIVGDAFTIIVGTTAPVVVGTGNGTIGTITLGADAIPGNYVLTCTVAATNGGTFSVVAPDGDRLADAVVGTAYVSRQINFTITDGSTDFIATDLFNLAVFNQLSGGKVVAWNPASVDGRQRVAGVLYAAVDASTADVAGVIVSRDAEVTKSLLAWAAGITAGQKASAYLDLAARGIIAR